MSTNVINGISGRDIVENETIMILSLFRTADRSPIPNQIYGILVAAARDPALYIEGGIDDSTMGRFDMLSLHIFLFVRRLRGSEAKGADEIGQDVFDLYVDGVEIALRELGIGDTSVPKRKKKMIHSFFGLADDLEGPLDDNDSAALETAVVRRFYAGRNKQEAALLCDYIGNNAAILEATPLGELLGGNFCLAKISQLAEGD